MKLTLARLAVLTVLLARRKFVRADPQSRGVDGAGSRERVRVGPDGVNGGMLDRVGDETAQGNADGERRTIFCSNTALAEAVSLFRRLGASGLTDERKGGEIRYAPGRRGRSSSHCFCAVVQPLRAPSDCELDTSRIYRIYRGVSNPPCAANARKQTR
jgi:hypothetical protein